PHLKVHALRQVWRTIFPARKRRSATRFYPWPKAEAKWAGSSVPASPTAPKASRTYRRGLRLSRVGDPQEFQVSVTEEEPAAGRPLAGVLVGCSLTQAECGQGFRLGCASRNADKEMVQFDAHRVSRFGRSGSSRSIQKPNPANRRMKTRED